jgi:hypothetical protein
MKRFAVPAFFLFFLLSCTKSNNTAPPPAANNLLKSFTLYYPQNHIKKLTRFSYQQNTLLANIREYDYDTINGISTQDSISISFKLTDSATPPASYDVVYADFQTPPAINTYHHLLSYDANKRVTVDSVATSSTGSNNVLHVFYDSIGNTHLQWLYPDPAAPGGYSLFQVDTLFVLSGNLASEINFTINQGIRYFNYANTHTYSGDVNPLYNTFLSNSVGCILLFGQLGDYISMNLPSQTLSQPSGSAETKVSYTWVTDGSGRVVSGTGEYNNTTQIVQIYSFSY